LQKPIEGLCCTGTFNAVLTGIEGVICGLSAVYLAIAEVLNETYGRTVPAHLPNKLKTPQTLHFSIYSICPLISESNS
jgi:hypothetical protein